MCLRPGYRLYLILFIYQTCLIGYAAPKPNYRLIMRQGTSREVKYPFVLANQDGQLKSTENAGFTSLQLKQKDKSISGTVVLAEKSYDLKGSDKGGFFEGVVELKKDPYSEAIPFDKFLLGKIPKLENLPMNTDPEKTVAFLISVLRFGDNYDQGEAAKKLGAMGDHGLKAFPEILLLLDSSGILPSSGAEAYLRELGPKAETAVPALIQKLKRNPAMGKGIAETLAKIGEPAIPPLIKLLKEDDYKWMQHAVHDALSQMGAVVVPHLIEVRTTNKSKAISVMLWMKTPDAAKMVIPVFLKELENTSGHLTSLELLEWLGARSPQELELHVEKIGRIRARLSRKPTLDVRCLTLLLKVNPDSQEYQTQYLKLLDSPLAQTAAVKGVEYLEDPQFIVPSLIALSGTKPAHCLNSENDYGLSPGKGNASEALVWLGGGRGLDMGDLVKQCLAETQNKERAINFCKIIEEILAWNVTIKKDFIPLLNHPFFDVQLQVAMTIVPCRTAQEEISAILEKGALAKNDQAIKFLQAEWKRSYTSGQGSSLTDLTTKLLPGLSNNEKVLAFNYLGNGRDKGGDVIKILMAFKSKDAETMKACASAIGKLLPLHEAHVGEVARRYVSGDDYLLPALVKAGSGAAVAADKLSTCLQGKDKEVKDLSARALASIGPDALPVLLRELSPEKPLDVAWAVLTALRDMGKGAVPSLPYMAAYATANPEACDRVVWAMRNIGASKEIKPFLTKQAKEGKKHSRYYAALLLAKDLPQDATGYALLLKGLQEEAYFYPFLVSYQDIKPLLANETFHSEFHTFVQSQLTNKSIDKRQWALMMLSYLYPKQAAEFILTHIEPELSLKDAKSTIGKHGFPFFNLKDHHALIVSKLNKLLVSKNQNLVDWALRIFHNDLKGNEETAELIKPYLQSKDRWENFMAYLVAINLGEKGIGLASVVLSQLGESDLKDMCVLLTYTSVTKDGELLVNWLAEPGNNRFIINLYAQTGKDHPELLESVKKVILNLPLKKRRLFQVAEKLAAESMQ